MTEDIRDIGYYKIEQAFLKRYNGSGEPFDISNYIATVSFTESIFTSVVVGSMVIADASNIIDRFPMRGEEILTFSYLDFYNQKVTQDFFVYSISDLSPNTQQNMTGYLLTFISPQALMSASIDVAKSYTGTTTDIIRKIFDQYLTDQTRFPNSRYDIDIEESTGVQTLVIPSISPLAAIEFCKKRSFSSENKSSNYLFFQNRKEFRMVTHEKIIKDAHTGRNFDARKIYTHDPALLDSTYEADMVMNNIMNIEFPRRINTMQEIEYGAMGSVTTEIDILRKQYRFFPYDYKDHYEEYTHLDKNVFFAHTPLFMEKYFDNFDNKIVSDLIFADYERPTHYYKEIIAPRRSSSYYLNNGLTCEIEIYGRNDLVAGDVIHLNLPQYESDGTVGEQHRSLAGYWIVSEMIHKFESKEYKCNVSLVKDLPKLGGSD